MTYQCSYVLRQLRKLTEKSESLMSYVSGSTEICLFENQSVTYDYSKLQNEINSIINELISQGYLVNGFNEYNFSLTHKGLHPYLVKWDIVKMFLIKSCLVPITVSITTTLLTLWLKGLLQLQ